VDIKAYIESGTLEAFVLGALSQEEEAKVRADIAQYPELAAEVAIIEDAMYQFAVAQSVEPPAGLQEQIWDAIQPSAATTEKTGGSTIRFTPSYNTRWNYAAVWVALVGSVVLNSVFWYQNSRQKQEVADNTAKMEKMANEQKILTALVDNYRKSKDMMADTAMQTIVMHTMQKGHSMAATLYWSKQNGDAYVSIDALPVPPSGMQYQLWVMQEGKPVDMGTLPVAMANTPTVQKVNMKVMDGQAFAISLEKAGGSPTPTMDKIYVMGKPA